MTQAARLFRLVFRFTWRKMLVALCASLVSFALFALMLQTARAAAHDATLDMGRTLLERLLTVEARRSGEYHLESHEFLINGASFTVETALLPKAAGITATQILEQTQASCRSTHPGQAAITAPSFTGGEKDDQYAFCLKPRRELSRQGMAEMAREFLETGDLSALGQYQGVFVRSSQDGVALLALKNHGSLVLGDLFPRYRDVAGADIAELPRPRGQRTFSVLHNQRPALTAYRTEKTTEQALDDFEQQTRAAGLVVLRPPTNTGKTAQTLFVRTPSESFLITSSASSGDGEKGSRTTASQLLVARLP